MDNINSRQALRDEVDTLLRSGHFEEVLSLLSRTETERGLDSTELVVKGRAIQLASEETRFPLAAAEEAFQLASKLDPEHVAALLELAWYHQAVEDDPGRALTFFERAIQLSRQQLTEAARGHAACLAQLDTPIAAAASLRSLHRAALLVETLDEEEQDWLEAEEV